MELEVGMYVRTETGQIGKITNFDGSMARVDTDKFITYKNFNSEIIKASHNIIDLIEVGDYVNGYPIYEIIEYEDNTRAIVIGDDNKSIIWEESSQYIKSIVTKEQFEAMQYKVV